MNGKTYCTIKLLLLALTLFVLLCMALDAQADEWYSVKSVQARGGLNVREQPSIEANATYLLEDTETVILLESRDGWALVAKNVSPKMVLGWVCLDYLK